MLCYRKNYTDILIYKNILKNKNKWVNILIDKIEEFCLKILEKIKLKKLVQFYIEHKEAMRYLVFGALTTLVNIVSYAIFAKLILAQIPNERIIVNISDIIAFIVSLIFAYITNKRYVFNSKTENKKELLKEITSFTVCRIFTQIISIIMMNASIWLGINDVIMKIIANIVIIILNFILSKLIIFKKNKKDSK